MNASKPTPATSLDALPCATDVDFTADSLVVSLKDGRRLLVPLEQFTALKRASERQRRNWGLIGGGLGIYWPDIDEDLSVSGILALSRLELP